MGTQSDIKLIEQFLSHHPEEATKFIENMIIEDIVHLLDSLPDAISAQVIANMHLVTSINCLQIMPIKSTIAIIEMLPMEYVSVLIRNLSVDLQKEILQLISQKKSTFLKHTLTFPEGTVGSIMHPLLYTFFEDISVGEALKILKSQSEINENNIYVVTRTYKIAGIITVNDLLRLKSNQLLGSVINKNVVRTFANVNLNLIQNHPGWQEYSVLPVVDNKDILQGILKYKDVRHFEEGNVKKGVPQHMVKASSALGELYRLGMTSLIQGASTLYTQQEKKS
jgi:Mg/Co/Ni transporter MgtE